MEKEVGEGGARPEAGRVTGACSGEVSLRKCALAGKAARRC